MNPITISNGIYSIDGTELIKNNKQKKGNHSKVWEYFRIHPETQNKYCIRCLSSNEIRKYKAETSTASMKDHLEKFHKIGLESECKENVKQLTLEKVTFLNVLKLFLLTSAGHSCKS
jgi:hypothetical protein